MGYLGRIMQLSQTLRAVSSNLLQTNRRLVQTQGSELANSSTAASDLPLSVPASVWLWFSSPPACLVSVPMSSQ